MKIRLIPPKIDAFDDDDVAVFTMEMADEFCASVDIRAWIDRDNWPHIQKAVSEHITTTCGIWLRKNGHSQDVVKTKKGEPS